MKRLYTVEFYRDMLARCREKVPGVAISSDFIVGFCGETEEAFRRSCDLVREAGFKNSFIFKYSPRPGTKADTLYADDVPEEVKRRRNNELLAIQNQVSRADHRRIMGQRVEVLVEGPSKTALKRNGDDPSSGLVQLTGRTRTDHIVVLEGHERLIGQTVLVIVEGASTFTLFGRVVTGEYFGCNQIPHESQPTLRIELPLVEQMINDK
jgi:tRNA-2-methylthio-N6-dimethylallyladenosine synthase